MSLKVEGILKIKYYFIFSSCLLLFSSEASYICSNQHVYLNAIKPQPNSPSDTRTSLYLHLKTCQKQFVCDSGYPSCFNLPSYSSRIPILSHPTFSRPNDTKKAPPTNRKPGAKQSAPSVTDLHPLCPSSAPRPSRPHRGAARGPSSTGLPEAPRRRSSPIPPGAGRARRQDGRMGARIPGWARIEGKAARGPALT